MADVFNHSRIVIDASVILAWLLPLETLQDKANVLVRRYEEHVVDIRCPSIIVYEVLNGLRSAVLSKRIKPDQLDEAYARYEALSIPIDYSFVPNNETLQLTMKYDVSVYDASYIHYAQRRKLVLYTADKKFVNKLTKMASPVTYLGDLGI